MSVYIITFLLFGAALIAMSVGVLFGRRPISGSCGGLAVTDGSQGRCEVCGWTGDPERPGETCVDSAPGDGRSPGG